MIVSVPYPVYWCSVSLSLYYNENNFSVPVGEHYIDVPQQTNVPNQGTTIESNDDIVSILPDTNQIDLEALGLLMKTELKSEPNSQDEGHSEGENLYL